MQKLYALTLAAATVFTATAGVHELKQNPQKTAHHVITKRALTAPVKSISKTAKSSASRYTSNVAAAQSRIGMMKADEKTHEIAGEYSMNIYDCYFEGSVGSYSGTATIVDNGNATITISSDLIVSPITADYDKSTGSITFKPEKIGRMTLSTLSGSITCYVEFEPGVYNWETQGIDVQEYSVTFDSSTGNIVFPDDHNFAWTAFSTDAYDKTDEDNYLGYVDLYDVLSFVYTTGGGSGNDPVVDSGIAGNYTFTGLDAYFDDSTGATVTCDVEIEDYGDGVIVLDGDLFPLPIEAAYDDASKNLTFSTVEYGPVTLTNGSTYYCRFEPGYYDWDTGKVVVTDYSVTYDSAKGQIVFPDDHNFGWPVYSDDTYTELKGYLDLFDAISLVKKGTVPGDESGEEQPGKWKDVGKATFVDAWVTALFEINDECVDPASFAFEVPLQQNIENPNIYRLWAPYHQPDFIFVNSNQSEYQGQIVFDITDPDHVVFQPGIPAGMLLSNGELYAYDMLGWQIWSFGNEWNDAYLPMLYEFMTENNQPFSTFKNGVVTVNESVFDFEASCTNAYSWKKDVVKTTVSTITFPDADSVEMVEVNDAPVEYFNMQGIRVEKPEAGQILIKRQGKEASKVVVR